MHRQNRLTCAPLLALLLTTTQPASAAATLSLHGSNTVGAKLAPECARSYLLASGATDVKQRAGTVENEQRLQADDGRIIDIAAHGSGTAFSALLDDSADIGMASRPIKTQERAALAKAGDMTSAEAEQTIAMDGLAVLVNRENPVSALTIEQIAQIFSGEIRNWREVGGSDAPITIYARDDKSGTWDTFAGLVLGERALAAGTTRFESNDRLSDSVAADRNAIGFSGLASVRQAKALAVADGDSRPILPTRLSVATEDYPLSRRLFLYLRPDRISSAARALVEHCQSARGQQIAEQVGFVSQDIIELKQEQIDNAPSAYRSISARSHRLSVNFRFREGNAQLDNKALRDLQRLADFMRDPAQQRAQIQLVGFNDGHSHGERDELISQFRALAVQAELMKQGIAVHRMIGVGAFQPVAAAGNDNAAAKNGRVEVWLSRELAAAPDTSASGR